MRGAMLFLALALSQPAFAGRAYETWLASLPPEGDAPTAEYVQYAATAYFEQTLKDPYSAHYAFGPITEGTFKGAFERNGSPGWIADVSVNARNSYGGYTGMTPYKFVFRSGVIVEVYRWDERMQDWFGMIGLKGRPFTPPRRP